MITARDAIKYKCITKGYELKDDDCIYIKNELVAKDVRVIEDNFDSIVFEMNVVDDRFGDLDLYDK